MEPMIQNNLSHGELERYIAALGVSDVLPIINRTIYNERNIWQLASQHFGADLAELMLTATHTKTIADFCSYKLWRNSTYLTRLFPDGYHLIEIGSIDGIGSIDSIDSIDGIDLDDFDTGVPVLVLKRGEGCHHFMGAYKHSDKWYFIDCDGSKPTWLGGAICYPSEPVNIRAFGRGHCVMWTVFFLHILMAKGPVTVVPKYVLVTLFQNYCANTVMRLLK
jgi:hypothetical protein